MIEIGNTHPDNNTHLKEGTTIKEEMTQTMTTILAVKSNPDGAKSMITPTKKAVETKTTEEEETMTEVSREGLEKEP